MPFSMRYASLDISDPLSPRSLQFGDVYFSREHSTQPAGCDETDYVFLQGCNLPEGWQQRDSFTIGELGFGTGLNFLHVMRRFLASSQAHTRLNYISLEAYPIAPDTLRRLYAAWNLPGAEALLAAYPLPVAGWHCLRFGRVSLWLGLGEAVHLLRDIQASTQVDAWFLDGFAPAKNPALWGADICAELARLSHSSTTLASYSAARMVRDHLTQAGFAITRRAGFGHKRHAIAGHYAAASARSYRSPAGVPRQASVIGAGIAGATIARLLADAGTQVVVHEATQPAAGASGNPAGVLYPHVTGQWGTAMRWHMAGFAMAERMLRGAEYWHPIGMLKTPKDARDREKWQRACTEHTPEWMRWVSAEEAHLLSGQDTGEGAWCAASGYVEPRRWVQQLLQHDNIAVQHNSPVQALCVAQASGCIILANSYAATSLLPSLGSLLFPSAGQVSLLPAAHYRSALRSVLCHRGYIIPLDGASLMGATYAHDDLECSLRQANDAANLAEAARALPEWLLPTAIPAVMAGGRIALRCSTRPRLPLVGCLSEGIYATLAHGSRGMVSAPYAAQHLFSCITGEGVGVGYTLADAVSHGMCQTQAI